MSIGCGPGMGGGITVMPLCVSCGGAASQCDPSSGYNYGGGSSPLGQPLDLCSCSMPGGGAGGGTGAPPVGGGGVDGGPVFGAPIGGGFPLQPWWI